VAGITGYLAIAALLKLITTRGFLPFAIYCFIVGSIGFVVL
jgi:undecaprenyl pyrophosphate phosphatase UppP